uniref:Uncharacterized protein n=1 Tax=Arundo donax TaxID=35708 RepID=A0A0A8ZST8_ARUDO
MHYPVLEMRIWMIPPLSSAKLSLPSSVVLEVWRVLPSFLGAAIFPRSLDLPSPWVCYWCSGVGTPFPRIFP